MVWAVSLLCSELSPGVLTALLPFQVFGVWLKTLRRTADSHPVALPLGYVLQDASPQAISERTSYCQTRLEFLPYTQVIPSYCTASGCGPPRGFTHASPCSYVARLASGLIHATLEHTLKIHFLLRKKNLGCKSFSVPRRSHSFATSRNPSGFSLDIFLSRNERDS